MCGASALPGGASAEPEPYGCTMVCRLPDGIVPLGIEESRAAMLTHRMAETRRLTDVQGAPPKDRCPTSPTVASRCASTRPMRVG